MKTKRKLLKFIDINTFDFTPYGRELTREEAYLVNGGSTVEDSHTVESGDTLGTLVYNYNKEIGLGIGVGYVKRELEGSMPVGIDGNLGFLKVSPSVMTDEEGLNGGAITIGQRFGLSTSTQKSYTLSIDNVINFFKGTD